MSRDCWWHECSGTAVTTAAANSRARIPLSLEAAQRRRSGDEVAAIRPYVSHSPSRRRQSLTSVEVSTRLPGWDAHRARSAILRCFLHPRPTGEATALRVTL